MNRSVAAKARPRLLAVALTAAILAPGAAFAQTAKERELEARIAQLEAQVQALLAQQQQQQSEIAQARTEVDAIRVVQAQVPAATAATAAVDGKPGIQSTQINSAASPGTRFSYGGFIKMDMGTTRTNDGDIGDGTVGRLFYVPKAIPVGGGASAEGGADTDFGANFSRFWFGSDTDLDSGDKLRSYLEFDLFGGGSSAFTGNEVATNTYALTLRRAYVTWNGWLAGQEWSNFQDTASLPDAVDFLGPSEGTVFVRQAQLRYTAGPWSFSLENPQTVLTPYQGNMAQIAGDDGAMPDVTARYSSKGDRGHFSVAGLARQLKYQDGAAGISESGTGFGVSVAGKFNVGASDDFRYMITAGDGIGRYIGLGLNNDAVLEANGELENIGVVAGFVGWRHVFSPTLRGNLFYSRAEYDNPTDLTGFGITRSAQSAHLNLIYTPLPKLDVGAELIWGQREIESGDRGELNRLQTHVKYSF